MFYLSCSLVLTYYMDAANMRCRSGYQRSTSSLERKVFRANHHEPRSRFQKETLIASVVPALSSNYGCHHNYMCGLFTTQSAAVANVTYPGVYRAFLSGIDAINFDLGFMLSTGCLWSDLDFHDRLLTDTIGPLAILALLGVTYAVALHRNADSGIIVREKIRNKHLSSMLLLVFLVYSSASSAVFRMFACDSLDDGKTYLRADYRILCADAKHRALQVYAAIMIFVYPVGIPLLYAGLLYRHRKVLSDAKSSKSIAKPIADLWEPYRPRFFYYEVVECVRRVVLTGVVVFIYPNDAAQIAITLFNTFFFFVVSEVLSPYQSISDMWLSRGGHLVIYFSLFDALLLKVDVSEERSESQHAFAWVLVALHAAMVVTIVVEATALYFAAKEKGRAVGGNGRSQRVHRKILRESVSVEAAMEDGPHPNGALAESGCACGGLKRQNDSEESDGGRLSAA